MSTYRDRRLAKAERLEEWADKREAKAAVAFGTAERMASVIPFGQPILVGHYSEGRDRRYRDRINANMGRGVENSRKADDFTSRAADIRVAADHAIYSDDADAVQRLEERIAALEAERDRIKAYNASCRRGERDLDLLDDKQRADLLSVAKHCAFQLGKKGEMPEYALTNLSGNINRQRKRLEELRRV